LNEATYALLRGDALPEKLEELRVPLLSILDELIAAPEDDAEAELRQQLLGDGSQTVAIMGQRGSGKSTLLAAVTAKLMQDRRHLVLPIMRPDQFGEADSVITTFLAQLWDLLLADAERGDEARVRDEGASIKLLADVARGSAMAKTTKAALEHGTEGPNDFADDFVAVSRSGVRLVSQLRRLAIKLCRFEEGQERARLIIVPIDDPDLARHNIIEILTDLQILSAIPGIVPVTCFSPDDLNQAWLDARQQLLPEASGRHLRFLLARQMEKAFPYRFRFEIEPIAPSQRPTFVPIAESVPLEEKFTALRRAVEMTANSLWPFDEAMPMRDQRFGLRSPLPDNARTLVQLWESLDVIGDGQGGISSGLIHLTIRRVLNVLTEPIAARTGSADLIQIGPPLDEEETVRAAEIDFARFKLFPAATSAEQELGEPTLGAFRLRRITELRVVLPEDPKAQQHKPEDYLSGGEAAALLAVQEIVLGSGLFDVRGGNVYLGYQGWAFLQTVEIANQVTDDVFLLLPDARTLSEVSRAASVWNDLVALTPEMNTEALLATAVYAACLTVERDAELKECRDYDDAFERAAILYSECLTRGGSTARSFIQWFERDLPLQWHSAFLSSERIRALAVRHREVREQPARHEYPHHISTSFFQDRLRFLLDSFDAQSHEDEARHSWLAGYFEVASSLESSQLERLSALYPSWQRDLAGLRAGAATTAGLQPSSSSRLWAAPYPTPEGTELLAAGLTALKRARRAARNRLPD
jgi:energy-coupling factor transporter ATP-binding protein EcfA2